MQAAWRLYQFILNRHVVFVTLPTQQLINHGFKCLSCHTASTRYWHDTTFVSMAQFNILFSLILASSYLNKEQKIWDSHIISNWVLWCQKYNKYFMSKYIGTLVFLLLAHIGVTWHAPSHIMLVNSWHNPMPRHLNAWFKRKSKLREIIISHVLVPEILVVHFQTVKPLVVDR